MFLNILVEFTEDCQFISFWRSRDTVTDVVGRKGQKSQWETPCGNCGIRHAPASCSAAGRRCHKCRKMNNFSRMYRGPEGQKKQVNTLDDCDSETEVMFVGAISAENKD